MSERKEEPKVLTVSETAKVLRMSTNAIYAAIGAKEIPSIRVGRKILVPKAALDQMLGGAKAAA